ncbi:uncharacterized protein FFB20_02710 [Fusarium fujikuroi]|uniref:Uncharacterized protein n=1 Tax=Fusarium fujikuroi TaxID=5127 RepID=A0A2H3RKZ0_FUSFU|nr:uncharacterized protein FFB20_02710 [Fusarium fujikuroi]SCN86318.1 uncharacterized protein FFC1_05120 [Fusarium fujikuroi]SCO23578.1 uncharacterized protein FFE2_15642 [Fusarium fujikuroi]SCO33676.1 uncharacterized protein FFNC_03370 [Fusarium fujikuroi]SCO48071.1 uncharacterized protein FFMR_08980 [Fusarium fujikuroi]
MDQSRANYAAISPKQVESGGQSVQPVIPAKHGGVKMDRWLKETPKDEPYHGLATTKTKK